jgi:hypothetical protein
MFMALFSNPLLCSGTLHCRDKFLLPQTATTDASEEEEETKY